MIAALAVGYPTHLWMEPYRECMARLCFGNTFSLRRDYDDKLIAAAQELVTQGYLSEDTAYYAMGAWYQRFGVGRRSDIRELKHGY